jgi:hypothetical protein
LFVRSFQRAYGLHGKDKSVFELRTRRRFFFLGQRAGGVLPVKAAYGAARVADKILEYAPKGWGFVMGTTLLFGRGKPCGQVLENIRNLQLFSFPKKIH